MNSPKAAQLARAKAGHAARDSRARFQPLFYVPDFSGSADGQCSLWMCPGLFRWHMTSW